MEKELIEQAKEELLGLMQDGMHYEHCQDSIEDLRKIDTLAGLVDYFNKYAPALRHKDFPPYLFMKKWFGEHLDEVNELGVYIDQTDIECPQTPDRFIFLFGCCRVSVALTEIKTQYVALYDDSEITLNMNDCTLAYVYCHGNSKVLSNQGRFCSLKTVKC